MTNSGAGPSIASHLPVSLRHYSEVGDALSRIPDPARIIGRALVVERAIDQARQIYRRLPVEEVLGLAVVHPVGMVVAFDLDGRQVARLLEVGGDLAVIDRT